MPKEPTDQAEAIEQADTFEQAKEKAEDEQTDPQSDTDANQVIQSDPDSSAAEDEEVE